MRKQYKRYAGISMFAAAFLAIMTLPAFAQTTLGQNANGNHSWQGRGPGIGMMNGTGSNTRVPGVFGTVSSISGSILMVTSRGFGATVATTTYTVDATNAAVYKNNATSTLSSVIVGDRVFVQGTVSGTSVTANIVRDGIVTRGRGPGTPGQQNAPGIKNQTSPIKGNGQPVVAGTVSAINGTNVTITTSSNTSYTIDASNTIVNKNGSSSSVSSIVVGDYVIVQGTVNGTSVTASSIIDNQATSKVLPGSIQQLNRKPQVNRVGMFGSIANFFKNLFGF